MFRLALGMLASPLVELILSGSWCESRSGLPSLRLPQSTVTGAADVGDNSKLPIYCSLKLRTSDWQNFRTHTIGVLHGGTSGRTQLASYK